MKDHTPTSDGQVESEDSTAFRPQETPLFSVNQRLLRCLHHASWCNQLPIVAVVLNSTLAPFQTPCTWNCEQFQGVSAAFEREGLLCTPLSVTLNLIE